MHQEAAEHLRE